MAHSTAHSSPTDPQIINLKFKWTQVLSLIFFPSLITISGLDPSLELQVVERPTTPPAPNPWACVAVFCRTKPCLTSCSNPWSVPLIPCFPRSLNFLAHIIPALHEGLYWPCQLWHASYPLYQNTGFYLHNTIKHAVWGGMNPVQHMGLKDIEFISHGWRGPISHLGFYATTVP